MILGKFDEKNNNSHNASIPSESGLGVGWTGAYAPSLTGYDWNTRDNTVYVIATFQDIGDMFMNLVGNHKIQMDVKSFYHPSC